MNRRNDIGLLLIFESQYFPANFTTKNIRSPCGETAVHHIKRQEQGHVSSSSNASTHVKNP